MQLYLNTAVCIAKEIGRFVTRSFYKVKKINNLNSIKFTLEMINLCKYKVISMVNRSYPDHKVIFDKNDFVFDVKNFIWVVNLLDGIYNFINGFPKFCLSISIIYKNKIEVSVIYDPLSNELFTATRGYGAYFNNDRIKVSSRNSLENSIIAFDQYFFNKLNYSNFLRKFFVKNIYTRSIGTLNLNFAYVASGVFDGFFVCNAYNLDIFSGILIIEESNGRIYCNNFLSNLNVLFICNNNIYESVNDFI